MLGRYTLSSGSLFTKNTTVGDYGFVNFGAGVGQFFQSGGLHEEEQALLVDYTGGYTLSGGQLRASSLNVDGSFAQSAGVLNISGDVRFRAASGALLSGGTFTAGGAISVLSYAVTQRGGTLTATRMTVGDSTFLPFVNTPTYVAAGGQFNGDILVLNRGELQGQGGSVNGTVTVGTEGRLNLSNGTTTLRRLVIDQRQGGAEIRAQLNISESMSLASGTRLVLGDEIGRAHV